jgi:hypothetical protein
MSPQRLTPDEVRHAQALVARVPGISSCHITAGSDGEVTEVHVVATAGKSAKLVARDVESLLKAEMGIDLDYRKIGVVTIDAGPDEPAEPPQAPREVEQAAPLAEFPVEEFASRFAFQSVSVLAARARVKAEVELLRDSVESFGSCQDDNVAGPPWRTIAEATLRAVSEFLDEGTRLCLVEVLKVAVGDRYAFVVSVDIAGERYTKSLAGCSMVSGNENQSVVHATLDAVNRVIGKLDFKSSIEYRIR